MSQTQDSNNVDSSKDVTEWNYQEFRKMKKRAMWMLFGWGAVNTVVGSIFSGKKNENRDFWIMNAGWGAVNAAIAGASMAFDKPKSSREEQEKEMRQFAKILGINAGLDLVYVGAGIAMSGAESMRNQEFGKSIIIQGTWLFAFDTIMWSKSKKFFETKKK